jgi:Putative Ig domain
MLIASLKRAARELARHLTFAIAIAVATPALAANYPLELVSPRAAGTAPSAGTPAIGANNRIFWAYPGLEYNIRATVIGGAYPFEFSLSDAPPGMTINSSTGEISWPDPTGPSVSPRITVTDAENASVSSSWTITVAQNRFIFIDAVNGREFDAPNPGTGTISNPFRRIRDLYSGDAYASKTDNRHVNKIAYFRAGTYYIDGYIEDRSGNNGGRMAVSDGIKPVAWIAFPGETAIIDGQCRSLSPQIGSRPCNYGAHIAFYDNGDNTYIDGFHIRNVAVHAFRTAGTGHYQTFRRNVFSVNGPTIDSVNQGFITTMTSASESDFGHFMSIQDNVFEDIEQGCCVKLYSTFRILIEDNICRDVVGGESEGFAVKGGVLDRVTVRHNQVINVYRRGIGGNMHYLRSAEILFNRVSGAGLDAMEINQNGLAGPVFIYRNTIVGRVTVRDVDSEDGPFRFYNNVIINSDPGDHIFRDRVSDASRVQVTNNLTGTASRGIVDSNLNLTPEFASYLGTRGYQLGAGTSPPSPPEDVRIE